MDFPHVDQLSYQLLPFVSQSRSQTAQGTTVSRSILKISQIDSLYGSAVSELIYHCFDWYRAVFHRPLTVTVQVKRRWRDSELNIQTTQWINNLDHLCFLTILYQVCIFQAVTNKQTIIINKNIFRLIYAPKDFCNK